MQYQFKTQPFDHQRRLFENTRSLAAHAVLWEQGTGKTKPMIDIAAELYEHRKIDALIVVAPNGVHRNWLTDEIPAHMPDRLLPVIRGRYYDTGKANTKWHQREMDALIKHDGFAMLFISYDAFMSEKGKKFVWRFLQRRTCLYILDEAHNVKSPGAKRTKSVVASGKYAPYRRILTGTPIATGPFDIYSQIRFLDEGFWKRYGLDSYSVYKQYFGRWFTAEEHKKLHGYDPGYDKLIEYQNLDKLHEILMTIGDRKTKDEVLDLPPKLFSKRYFDMQAAQRDMYDELRSEYMVELEDGAMVDGGLAIVRLLRLQQITCGYIKTDLEEPVRLIGNKNPRLDLLQDIVNGLSHPAIIWARFTKDIDQIMDVLGDKAVRYDGQLSDDENERSKIAFQKGDADWFVGNPAKGKEGLTLVRARTVIYYSNSFKLIDRLQSEDRAHRIGQEHPVNYIDLIANGTVDMHIVRSLVNKLEIAGIITGDKLRDWL